MTRASVGLLLAALAASVTPATAQLFGPTRTAVIFENYSFDTGLIFDRVTEMTVPLGMDFRLGRLAGLAVSTGYARITLRSTDAAQLPSQDVSGLLDTELRLSLNIIPGRLVAIASGVIPTGIKTVEQEQLSILGAISSDVIGFASPAIGSGGAIGGGFAGAIPLGRFAFGLGATYRLPLAYQPVLGRTDDLKPGAEIRVRAGLEGPLSRRTYTRVAVIYASRGQDEVASTLQSGVGNRLIAYASVNQQIGRAALNLYGFDVFRGEPQLDNSPVGVALLPRGNLLAAGFRLAIPIGRRTELTPRAELRFSSAAPDTSAAPMERLGQSSRFGFDLRHNLSRVAALVLQAGLVTGNVRQADTDIGFNGWRTGFHVELRP